MPQVSARRCRLHASEPRLAWDFGTAINSCSCVLHNGTNSENTLRKESLEINTREFT